MRSKSKLFPHSQEIVTAPEIREQVRELAPTISMKEYFRIVVPGVSEKKLIQLKESFHELGVPFEVTALILSTGRISHKEQVAMISNSLGYKLSLKQSEKIIQLLRGYR